MTQFQSLRLSDNSKVRFFREHHNTFGIKYGKTCPGATKGQGGCLCSKGKGIVCYAAKLHKMYPNYSKTIDFNTDLVFAKPYEELVVILRNTVLKFLLNGGFKAQYFRISQEGDIFNDDYVKAWAKVINEWPSVQFWMYTRSMFAIPILAQCKNLALYLSMDSVNKEAVLKAYEPYKDYTNVSLAVMSDDLRVAGIKFVECPEITGKVKNTKEAGACSKCQLCFNYNERIKLRAIRFKIH